MFFDSATARGAAHDTGSFFGNLLLAPFQSVVGFVQGALGSLGSGLLATGVLTALATFAPQLAVKLAAWIGGEETAKKLAESLQKDGVVGALKVAAPLGFGAAGLFGGSQSMIERATGQAPGEGGFGTIVGASIVMAVVGSVALGALTDADVKPAGAADTASAKTPPKTPPGAPAAQKQK